jgi:hypothetical protein
MTMLRYLLPCFALALSICTKAQTGTDQPVKTGSTGLTTITAPVSVVVSGDHDVAPAPATCVEKQGQPRLNCLSNEVLAAIRAKMDPADAGKSYPSATVVVTFVINQFGDMKDIRVEHQGTADLSKKVIVALYALPKFTPATKGGSNVGSTVKVTYAYEALFAPEK